MSKFNKQKTDIRYLSPVDIDKRNRDKYCRFKKMGIKYIDYKDPDFLMRFFKTMEPMVRFRGYFR